MSISEQEELHMSFGICLGEEFFLWKGRGIFLCNVADDAYRFVQESSSQQ